MNCLNCNVKMGAYESDNTHECFNEECPYEMFVSVDGIKYYTFEGGEKFALHAVDKGAVFAANTEEVKEVT